MPVARCPSREGGARRGASIWGSHSHLSPRPVPRIRSVRQTRAAGTKEQRPSRRRPEAPQTWLENPGCIPETGREGRTPRLGFNQATDACAEAASLTRHGLGRCATVAVSSLCPETRDPDCSRRDSGLHMRRGGRRIPAKCPSK